MDYYEIGGTEGQILANWRSEEKMGQLFRCRIHQIFLFWQCQPPYLPKTSQKEQLNLKKWMNFRGPKANRKVPRYPFCLPVFGCYRPPYTHELGFLLRELHAGTKFQSETCFWEWFLRTILCSKIYTVLYTVLLHCTFYCTAEILWFMFRFGISTLLLFTVLVIITVGNN